MSAPYKQKWAKWPWKRSHSWKWPFCRPHMALNQKYKDPAYVRNKERTVVHETVHCVQLDDMGLPRFLWKYKNDAGRLELEAPAYAASARWNMANLNYSQQKAVGLGAVSLYGRYCLKDTFSVTDCEREIRRWL